MQLMLSIGSDGTLLPHTSEMLKDLNIPDSRIWNPTRIILNACAALFHAVIMINSPKLWYSETETLQYLCSNALYWIMLVKQLCKVLEKPQTRKVIKPDGKGSTTQKFYVMPDFKEWNLGEKQLYFREFAAQKRAYGADNRTYDTQASEGLHKLVIKPIISRTSKRSSSMLHECSSVVEHEECLELIEETFKRAKKDDAIVEERITEYPYIYPNSKTQEVVYRFSSDGIVEKCSVRNYAMLYYLLDMRWLGLQVLKLLRHYNVDATSPWKFRVLAHETMSVLGKKDEVIKMAYSNVAGKNCCGIVFNSVDPVSGDTIDSIGRVCGIIEIIHYDDEDVPHSTYKVVVAVLKESLSDESFLPFPIHAYKLSSRLTLKYKLIQPQSVTSGLMLVPFLKSNCVFDTLTDVQAMQFYVIRTSIGQFGAFPKKSISTYTDDPLDQPQADAQSQKCFLHEAFLRLEQEELGLNERKTRKSNVN
jgi:hypothetical protein